MLQLLFRRLTGQGERGGRMFDAVAGIARQRHWYVEGGVPDTIDGRFSMVATVCALVLVRLERDGEAGNPASVGLTERFIAVMESEHRELGLGDPALGRKVRKLVASLARRVGLWRSAASGDGDWLETTRASVALDGAATESVDHVARELEALWDRLCRRPLSGLAEGRFE